MRRKLVLSIALSFIGTMCLSSCGSNNNDNALVVGLECNYSPFNWTVSSSNDYTLPIADSSDFADGYDIQISKALAEKLGYSVTIKRIVWESLIPSLNTNLINCIIAGMSYSEERDKSVDFTSNYYTSQMTVIVRNDSKYASSASLADLTGAKVVSQLSTLTDDIIDQIPNVIHQSPLKSFGDCALSVTSGASDAMTAEYPVARSIVNSNSDLKLITFTKENGFQNLDNNELGVAVAVKEGNTTLRDKLNTALSEINEETRQSLMDGAILRANTK